MGFYCEITLLPNPEVNINFLWSKVFQQIHLGLVEMQDDQGRVPIGIAFPEYVFDEKFCLLGSKLRLFAQNEATVAKFDVAKWLSRLSDYVHCTSIRPVPDKLKGYANYSRIQPITSKERLARRYSKRHNINFETALTSLVELSVKSKDGLGYEKKMLRYAELPNPTITLPFIRQKSLSGGGEFCLWIKKSVVTEPSGSTYSSYGLSTGSTVPEF